MVGSFFRENESEVVRLTVFIFTFAQKSINNRK